MKRAFLFFVFILIAFLPPQSLYAADEDGAITRLGKWLDGNGQQCECPTCPKQAIAEGVVCPDTPLEKIKRPAFELELGIVLFDTPADGGPQFHLDNFYATLYHYLSPVFGLYGSYSSRKVEKNEYEDSVYDKEWSYQTLMAGVVFYPAPTVKLFLGGGKSIPKNSEGTESLNFAMEYGFGWDIPLNHLGYKLGVTVKAVEAGLSDKEAKMAASAADGSTNIVTISLMIPISGW